MIETIFLIIMASLRVLYIFISALVPLIIIQLLVYKTTKISLYNQIFKFFKYISEELGGQL